MNLGALALCEALPGIIVRGKLVAEHENDAIFLDGYILRRDRCAITGGRNNGDVIRRAGNLFREGLAQLFYFEEKVGRRQLPGLCAAFCAFYGRIEHPPRLRRHIRRIQVTDVPGDIEFVTAGIGHRRHQEFIFE